MLEAKPSKSDKEIEACCTTNYWTIWKILYLALTCVIIILYNIYLLRCSDSNSCYVPFMEVILWTLFGAITFVPIPHLKGFFDLYLPLALRQKNQNKTSNDNGTFV